MNKRKIFFIAGESSGDMHAASLIRELKILIPGIEISGIGGPEMLKEDVILLYNLKEVNFIGFTSVAINIRKIKAILDNCISYIKQNNPEAVVLVDYPGFNLKFIKSIRKFYKGKIIYYISPQLWAWHKSRVKTIREFVDLMLVVFPFEKEFYSVENVKAEYTGHPLISRIDNFLKNNKKIIGNDNSSKDGNKKPTVSFLPGSRKDEIERMLPVLLEAAKLFKKEFNAEINFICSSNFDKEFYKKFIKDEDMKIIYDGKGEELNYRTILNSDLVITKSGTSTMECALIGTPFCVVYKTGKLNYEIGKRLVKVDHIAMVNILLKRKAVKEFLQDEMTPENIFTEGKKILTDVNYRNDLYKSFKELRNILGSDDASFAAAEFIQKILIQNN